VLGGNLVSKKFKGQKVEGGADSNVIQLHQPIIKQQLGRNNIALYFAAVKLQVI
jgi:hypothetical protein